MTQTMDSNLRGIPNFWSNYTVEPPTQWTNRIDQYRLAIIAKENLEIDNLKKPLEWETTISILEGAQDSEYETQKKAREVTNKEVMRVWEIAEDNKIIKEKRKIWGMRRNEADKKVRFILYLALGAEVKVVFSQKHPMIKVLSIP